MAIRQKQKRSDEAGNARPQSTTPIAEAIAIGTAAGGLVIGAMRAQADDRTAVDEGHGHKPLAATTSEHASDGTSNNADTAAPEFPLVDAPPAPHGDIAAVPVAMLPELSQAAMAGDAPLPPPVATVDVVPTDVTLQPGNDLAHDLAGQITASLTKAIDGVGAGTSTADLGLSIANDLVQSAQHIVANLGLGSTTGLAQSILADIDPQGIVQNVLAQTSHIADTVLADVSDIPAAVLADVPDLASLSASILDSVGTPVQLASLADLPSSILGNEGPDGLGGMLSEVFYQDGAADSLGIPDLSLAASSLLPSGGADALGFLGVSYVDTALDHAQGLGLNALSLL